MGISFIPEQILTACGIKGLVIGRIAPDGPASRAGLRGTLISPEGKIEIGGIILTIEGKSLRTANNLFDILEKHQAGNTGVLEYERGGQRKRTTITLEIMETP